MTSFTNQSIGPYEISREIGRGGMGVVYLARDTRLDHNVAVTALPEHLSQDPDRLARFEREAKTLAQLNHPNVAGIYGVEEHEGARYLILEYVEGETVAARIDRGALPVDEALEVAVQIAAGVRYDVSPDGERLTFNGILDNRRTTISPGHQLAGVASQIGRRRRLFHTAHRVTPFRQRGTLVQRICRNRTRMTIPSAFCYLLAWKREIRRSRLS